MLEQWSGLVGTFLPMVIAVILQKSWSTPFKAVASLLTCLAAATVTTAAQGKLDPKNWTESAAIVFTAAMVSFHSFWKPTGIADAVEKATSKTTSVPPGNAEPGSAESD